jgi:antitoxin (DNA-binding transcriptional repressor) of toxin-antitoxin stability system
MRTISAVDLRNDLEGIVKSLRRGERMELTYRGEKVDDLIPPAPKAANEKALAALRRAWDITSQIPDYEQRSEAYLKELREDQRAFGDRTAS